MPLVVKLVTQQTLQLNGGLIKNISPHHVRLAVLDGAAERGPVPSKEERRQARNWLSDMSKYRTRREQGETR